MTAAQQGLAVYSAIALAAGILTRRHPATIGIWAAAGWVPYLLVHYPYAGGTVALAIGWVAVHRYGWRHLLLWGGLGSLYSLMVWARISYGGVDFGAAALDAAGRTLRFAVFTALCWWAWRLMHDRVSYVTHPLAWGAESRRVQQLAEHRRAMGLGKRGLGRLGHAGKRAITAGRPAKPDDGEGLALPGGGASRTLEGGRSRDRRGRFLPADAVEAAPLDAGQIGNEPLFAPKPRWRRRR
jgi:hypothetical protein